ncbi:MAG: type IV conjugative transfer system coupling protein TraD, partial [Saezia sp.]
MAQDQANEVLLRPAVEVYSVAVCTLAALLCIAAPWAIALSPRIGFVSASMFMLFAVIRGRDALMVMKYRRNI